jgi:hypothetical protein
MRLCKTDPKQIFDKYAWDEHRIKSRQDMIAWVAARKPKVTNKDDAEAEAEVVKAFVTMIQRFFHLDSRAVILPRNDKKHINPIIEGKTPPKLRDQMKQ